MSRQQKTPFLPGARVKTRIDRLATGGRGVARHEGLVIFVPFTAPGDEVEIEITSVKKSFAEGRLVNVLNAGPSRIQAPCPVFGICGGCNLQHVAYEEQLNQKRGFVRDALRKFSGFDVSQDDSVHPVLPSPKPFRYRNRIQLHLRDGLIGYYKRGSHEIVAIDDCPIAEEALATEIPTLRKSFALKGANRVEIFLLETESGTEPGKVGRRLTSTDSSKASSKVELDGEWFEHESGSAFSQVNTDQNRNLIDFVLAEAKPLQPKILYDLYSGNGNFTFPLALAFPDASLTSVELNSENVERARDRAQREFAGRSMRIERGDVGTFVEREKFSGDAIVLLDPPRTGCGVEVMKALSRSPVKNIVYVSCNPVTLARDLRVLFDAGFELMRVQPFDMFPQTDHVEVVIHAKKA